MKMISLILLFLIPKTYAIESLGGGTPYIQAVCKITLTDDSVIEGFFNIGGGGIMNYYKPDGFYLHFKKNDSHQIRAFNLEFKEFRPLGLRAFRDGEVEVYYAQNTTRSLHNKKKQISIDPVCGTLTKMTSASQNYELKNELTVYTKLPNHLVLDFLDESCQYQTKINVNNIKEFRFYKSPPAKWLDKIRTAEKNDIKKVERVDTNNWEYTYHAWYHEILKDEAMTNSLMRYF